jgi:hypothetical protein
MRRVLAILAGLMLATATFAGTALGAPANRFSDTQTSVVCEGLTNDAGTAFVFAAISEEFGSFADLAFWASPATPETDPPTWITDNSAVVLDGATLMATFDLFEFQEPVNPEDPPFGDPVGEATLEATLTPLGDPQPYSFQDQSGNHVFRIEGVFQELAVSGTLELPDEISYNLSPCFAGVDSFTVFSNSPASSVDRFSELQLSCGWETADGFVSLFASNGDFGGFADLFVSDTSGDYFGFSEGTLTDESFSATWDLFPVDEGGELDPVGSAEASADLTRTGERINDTFRFGDFKVHVTGEILAVDGMLELTTPGGSQSLPMDGEHCYAADVRETQLFSPAQGPRGRPLANDTPEGAEPIAIGESVTVNTGGTAEAPEEPCLVNDGQFELPFGHTAWWTIEGSGADVLVDTAGSEFDTALGVYTLEGETFVQVGCVDDVDSLLARITVATDAGVTYYVQAGGFAAQSGKLVLSVT